MSILSGGRSGSRGEEIVHNIRQRSRAKVPQSGPAAPLLEESSLSTRLALTLYIYMVGVTRRHVTDVTSIIANESAPLSLFLEAI